MQGKADGQSRKEFWGKFLRFGLGKLGLMVELT